MRRRILGTTGRVRRGFADVARAVRNLRARPAAERRLVLQALALVLVARLGLWILPTRGGVRRLAEAAARTELTPPAHRPERDSIVWAVRAASRRVPRASCLTQALAAQALLGRYGYASRLALGVYRSDAGVFEAHAWLESDGRVLIGDIGLERFHRFPDPRAAPISPPLRV